MLAYYHGILCLRKTTCKTRQNCSATLKQASFMNHTISLITHCVKSVQIRRFFWSVVSRIRTRQNSISGHFSCSDFSSKSQNKARKSETGRIWRSFWYYSEWNYNTNYIIVWLYHSHYIIVIILHYIMIILALHYMMTIW